MLCSYGCGKEATYFTKRDKKPICSKKINDCSAIRQKNSAAIKALHASGKKMGWAALPKEKRINPWTKGKTIEDDPRIASIHKNFYRLSYDEYLAKTTCASKKFILKRGLLEYKCIRPGCENKGEWLGIPIVLHLHHKDGDNKNNVLNNLCFLCPNCHSQTINYAGAAKKGRKYLDEK